MSIFGSKQQLTGNMEDISRSISILINVEKSFVPKAEYIFRTMCKILGLQPNFYYDYTREDIHVYYGPPAEDKRAVEIYYNEKATHLFSKKMSYQDDIHFVKYRNENIPFLFSENGPIYLYTAKSIEIRKDIIASAFFFLSCWQEYTGDSVKSKRGNETEETLQYLWDFHYTPVVDRYCDILKKALETILPGHQTQKKWSSDKDFPVSMSLLSCDLNEEEQQSLVKKREKKELKTVLKPFKKQDTFKTYPQFFLPACPDSQKIAAQSSILDLIQSSDKSKTVGLFSKETLSAKTITESSLFYAEQGLIVQGSYVIGMSSHYQKLFEEYEKTDIRFDISMCYPDSPGYRAGISYPFFPFNIEENRPFKTLEIPPSICKKALCLKDDSKRFITNHLDYLVRDASLYKNHLGIVWNLSFQSMNNCNVNNIYLRLVKSVQKKQAWLCTPCDIYNHWLNR